MYEALRGNAVSDEPASRGRARTLGGGRSVSGALLFVASLICLLCLPGGVASAQVEGPPDTHPPVIDWLPDPIDSGPDDPPGPPGACCFQDGSCEIREREACQEGGGIFVDGQCDPDSCDPEPGLHEGGVLVLHHPPGLTYTSDNDDYSGQSGLPTCTAVVDSTEAMGPIVVFVLALFEDASPRLKGVTFGFDYSSAQPIGDFGSLGDFEIPTSNWPEPNEGTAVTWAEAQTSLTTEVYWFYVYSYASYYGPETISIVEHPIHGSYFANDRVPSDLHAVHDTGVFGLGTSGYTPCPVPPGGGGPIDFAGFPHTPLGDAVLTPDGSSLIVGSIGSSGMDGVSIDLGTQSVVELAFEGPDAGTLPSSAELRTELSGRLADETETSFLSVTRSIAGAGFALDVQVDPTLVHPDLPADSLVLYEVFDGCDPTGSAVGPEGTVLLEQMIAREQMHRLGPGDPFNGVDVSLIDKSINHPIAFGVSTPEPFDFELPGGEIYPGDRLRASVINPPVAPIEINELRVTGRDLDSFTITNERAADPQPLSAFGLMHQPVGFTTLDDSGGMVAIVRDSSSCEAKSNTALSDPNAYTTAWSLDDLDALPDGAAFETGIQGELSDGRVQPLLSRSRRRISDTEVALADSFHPAILPAEENVRYEAFLAGEPVAAVETLPADVMATVLSHAAPGPSRRVGPGDPFGGVDVSIVGEAGVGGAGGWSVTTTYFESPQQITLPGISPITADKYRVVVQREAPPVTASVAVAESQLIDIATLTDAQEAALGEIGFSGLDVANLGNASLGATSTTLSVDALGSSGEDGLSVDLGEKVRFTSDLVGPDWATLPDEASLRTELVFEDEEGGTTHIVSRTRRKDADGGSLLTVYTDHVPPELLGEGGLVHYEALLDGVVVDSVTTTPGVVAVTESSTLRPAAGRLGPGDPFNGVDVSLIDKSINNPVAFTTTWEGPFAVSLPGGADVTADAYRVSIPDPAIVPESMRASAIRGIDVPSFTIERLAAGTIVFEGFDHNPIGDVGLEVSDDTLTISDIGPTGVEGVSVDVVAQDVVAIHAATDDADSLSDNPRRFTDTFVRTDDGSEVKLGRVLRLRDAGGFQFSIPVDPMFIDDSLHPDSTVVYEVLMDCVPIGRSPGGRAEMIPVVPVTLSRRGPGDPFNGVDVSLIDKSTNNPIMLSASTDDVFEFTLPGSAEAVVGNEIRARPRTPPVEPERISRVEILAEDIPELRVTRERAARPSPETAFGLDLQPVGFTTLDPSGGVLGVTSDPEGCEAKVNAALSDPASYTTEWDAPDLASVPDGASITSGVEGTANGERVTLAERTRRRVSATAVELVDRFGEGILSSGDSVRYEAFCDGYLTASVVTLPQPITVALSTSRSSSDWRGPGDPFSGVDVSLIDKSTNNPIAVTTAWDTDFDVTLPGHPTVCADRVRATTLSGPISDVTGSVAYADARKLDTLTVLDAEQSYTEEVELFGLRFKTRGRATASIGAGGVLHLSNIGSSGEDGASAAIPGVVSANLALKTRDWSSLPEGAYLRKSLTTVGQELGSETRTIGRTRRKAPEPGSDVRTVFRDDFPDDVVGPSGTVHYQALLGGAVVESVTTVPSDVVVCMLDEGARLPEAAARRGPGDPFNGVDVSLIDKSTNNPIAVGTDWSTTFDVKLPGRPAVLADGYRAMVDGDGILPDVFEAIRLTGRALEEFTIDDASVSYDPCACDSTWVQQPVAGPAGRVSPAVAYDSDREVTVLFGGAASDGTRFGDTWEWDGNTWTERTPATSPSPRASSGIAYDSQRQVVVLYGGSEFGGNRLGDTWEWDGDDWTNTTTGGANRSQMGMAYDAAREVVVRYAGAAGSGRGRNTWEYDGSSWTMVHNGSSGGPGYRSNHAMAYDPALGGCVTYAGETPGGALENDTWLWDGASWTQLTSGPDDREFHSLEFDAGCGGLYLFGGSLSSGAETDELWKFIDNVWIAVNPTTMVPAARERHGAAYDATRGQLVVLGGRDMSGAVLEDTWVFGCQPVVADVDPGDVLPASVRLDAMPNPFRSRTTMRYVLPDGGPVQLRIFDVGGRLVRTLVDRALPAGTHEVLWNGRDQAGRSAVPGVYFYRLDTPGGQQRFGKLVRLR